MYYLNDQHSKYEYTVYCKVSTAMPYLIRSTSPFTEMQDVCRFLEDKAKIHNKNGDFFYIDNDFYKNECILNPNGVYYKVLRRNVNDWEEFKQAEEKNNNNIIYLFK